MRVSGLLQDGGDALDALWQIPWIAALRSQ
jgi:hypothetical protein